jgi:multiple sugar transport system substrate-binding protein
VKQAKRLIETKRGGGWKWEGPGCGEEVSFARISVSPCLRGKILVFFFCGYLFSEFGMAHGIDVYFYQLGYVEGGAGPATTLTDAAVAAFEREHSGIDVHVVGVPWGKEGNLKLRTALLARRRIDLFRLAHDQLPAFLPREGRLLAPVGPFLSDADRADFGEAALAAVTINGEPMAWPLWSTAIALVVNVELLERAGVILPKGARAWTWEEFEAALRAVADLKSGDGRPVYGFNAAARPPFFEWAPLLMAHCGPIFSDAGLEEDGLTLAPDFARALQRVRTLGEAGLTAPGFGTDDDKAAQQGFLDGRVAMLMTSPGFLKRLPPSGLRFAVVAPPTGAWGRPITTGGLGCVAVVTSDDAGRVAAAHALARYLTSAGIAGDVPGWYLAPPVRGSITAFFDDPLYRPLAAILPTVDYLQPPGRGGFMERIVVPRLQAAMLGETTPEEAVVEIRAAWRRRSLE